MITANKNRVKTVSYQHAMLSHINIIPPVNTISSSAANVMKSPNVHSLLDEPPAVSTEGNNVHLAVYLFSCTKYFQKDPFKHLLGRLISSIAPLVMLLKLSSKEGSFLKLSVIFCCMTHCT